ncbi:hypothetical protein [Coleofasciculus sp. FACHB-SPT9]|nr:hypothetical protein [Coleofasciculus sp. FACHB-SPT9]MBD1887957.1 hypothetical protein [Coleofasciculus sp. FACHB-SPT9]
MNKLIAELIRLIMRSLPDLFVEEINAASLDELDTRGLIFWADGENPEG